MAILTQEDSNSSPTDSSACAECRQVESVGVSLLKKKMKMIRFAICISFIVISLMFVGQNSTAVTIADAVGIWLFDNGPGDVAEDSSENGNDGTLKNDPTWVDGKFGKALDFDGVDDVVNIEFPNIALTSWTVAAWIYPRNLNVAHYQGLVQAWPSQGEFQIQTNTSSVGVHPVYGGSLNNDEWAHVAGRVVENQVYIYINGNLVTQGAVSTVTFSNVGIGAIYDAQHGYEFDGIIDDVAIFNVALTEDDITDIMNQGLSGALGIAAVSPTGKLTTTWADIKK